MNSDQHDQKILGENLRLLRKVRRLSQKKMADIMGVSVYCIRKLEQGVYSHPLQTEVFTNLSRYFHLHPATFFKPQTAWKIDMLFHGEDRAEI